ncbi:fumarylacetoacetate hydrolase family protein [Nocardia sp. NPDC004750]
MRLATYHEEHRLVAAFVLDGRLVPAVHAARAAGIENIETFSSVRNILSLDRETVDRAHRAAQLFEQSPLDIEEVQLAPPIPDPDKIVCLGLNYLDHAAENALAAPPAPMLIAKYRNSLTGHRSPIHLPAAWSTQVDYEGEIAVVVGATLSNASESEAIIAAAGWMPFNDVSARDLQLLTPQWTAGKAADSFGPCGPYLTVDDALTSSDLKLTTRLNGEIVQEAVAADMIFSVARTLSFLSSFMTLVPGDIVATGTPAGIGFRREPQRFLRAGDTVEVQVGDCVLSNPVSGPQ